MHDENRKWQAVLHPALLSYWITPLYLEAEPEWLTWVNSVMTSSVYLAPAFSSMVVKRLSCGNIGRPRISPILDSIL